VKSPIEHCTITLIVFTASSCGDGTSKCAGSCEEGGVGATNWSASLDSMGKPAASRLDYLRLYRGVVRANWLTNNDDQVYPASYPYLASAWCKI
jgi:hypothetical protein